MMKWIGVVSFLIFTVVHVSGQSDFKSISAHDARLYYSGRTDMSDNRFVRYDWPGVGVHFKFSGRDVALKFNGGEKNYFNLLVDGRLKEVVHSLGDTILWINGLKGKGPHQVDLVKRTEGDMGQVLFYGLLLKKNGQMDVPDFIKSRKIEFIGNSITCGYGTEGVAASDSFKPETENNQKAYGAILARAFNAEGRYSSHSGLGVVRNYGDPQKISTHKTSMTGRFNRTLDNDSSLLWDFASWVPHVVVINLGTNDFSTRPHPDKAVFQRAYEKLILDVRAAYGNIPVFCMVGPMLQKPAFEYVMEVVDIMNTLYGDDNVYFIGLPDGLLNRKTDLGADSHPAYSGQKKMAEQLVQPISTVLGWDFETSELFGTY
ncbi:GDSL-type esterase/lipase family protein [Geofilum sp. OHC36d9]|uniref:GDSL-type esterase/lipase family protein n=1 Tax=Geofilum sp. OHC36d9 TaxID=3458413 RepID=UPI0040342265